MLLLGALFALFISGFWLYCLVDVALTPSNECRGLPKAAWIAIVAGTFVIGATVWLVIRYPARPAIAPPGHDGDAPPSPRVPRRRNRSILRNGRRDPRGGSGPGQPGGGASGPAEPGGGARGPGQPGGGASGPGQPGDGPDRTGTGPAPGPGTDATAALLRHPAGRSRLRGPWSSAGQSRARGPDDDPEFLRFLNRAIHGADAGDDPAGHG